MNIDEWLDNLEPDRSDARDASHMRRIIAAADAVEAATDELADAVNAARNAGDTWAMIGVALGITRQAAFQRFGQGPTESRTSSPAAKPSARTPAKRPVKVKVSKRAAKKVAARDHR